MLQKLTSKVIFLCIGFFLFTFFYSCDTVKGLQKPFTAQKSASNTYRASDWKITPEYRKRIQEIGTVESWAYQKLLIQAINEKNIPNIKKYISQGANPNRGISKIDYNTGIGLAIKNGCYECINALSSKVEINHGYSSVYALPMVQAAKHSTQMMNYLFENFSIDVNAYSTSSKTSGIVSVLPAIINSSERELSSKSKEKAIRLLLSKGAKPMYSSLYAVHAYLKNVEKASLQTIKLFINHGANFNWFLNNKGTTMLGYAMKQKRYQIVKELLKIKTDPNYCISSVNTINSPLYYAVVQNNLEMVKVLVENGANVQYKGCWQGKLSGSLLNYALEKNINQDIIDYLISKGAK